MRHPQHYYLIALRKALQGDLTGSVSYRGKAESARKEYGIDFSESVSPDLPFLEGTLDTLLSSLDFARCVRPDGTAYGTGGQCRRGVERDKVAQSSSKTKVKAEPKPNKGMRITAKIKALSAKDLAKVLEDPRLNDKQRASLQKLIEEKQPKPKVKRERRTAVVKPPVKTKETVAPVAKTIPKEKPKRKEERAPTKGKISDEKLKESFDNALATYNKYKGKWTVKEKAKADRALEAISTIRQAYFAKDRESFLRASAELRKLPKDAPLKEREILKREVEAAYFGEPRKPSPLTPQGKGKVDASVPKGLPRGGGDKQLKDFLDGSEVIMAFSPEGFGKFIQDGVAKNGFEAGTGGLKVGKYRYLDEREKGEQEVMGIPRGSKPTDRPVYAALEHPDRSRSLQGSNGLMSQYGGIQVVMNDSVKDRASFTMGDSLDYNAPRGIQASPVRDPANPTSSGKKLSINYGTNTHTSGISIRDPKDSSYQDTPPYVEAQIHGGLRSSDIREVRYYRGTQIDQATLSSLQEQGVRVVELPPRRRDIPYYDDDPGFSDITSLNPRS